MGLQSILELQHAAETKQAGQAGFTDVPLEDGLSMADAVDFHLERNPDRACFVYGVPDGRVCTVSYREFGCAVHAVAHALRPARQGADGAVVAVIALSDTLLYHAVTAGLMKAGLVPFPISPRLSAPAVAGLLRASGCRRLVTTQCTLSALVVDVQGALGGEYGLIVDEMPALRAVYPHLAGGPKNEAFEPYPDAAVAPQPEDVQLYIHSSGSTGFPKAIPQTRASIVGWTRFGSVTDVRRFSPRPRFAAHILPPFHGFGIWAQLLIPLFGGAETALFPPVVATLTEVPPPPTPDAQLAGARASGASALATVPAYIHHWAEDPTAVEYLKTLQVVAYGGGPLSEGIGAALAGADVRLRSILGASEFGIPSHLKPTRDADWAEWQWIELDANAALEWVRMDDGTEELVIPVGDCGDHWHKPAVLNMADRSGYATNDLWIAHPTKLHLRRIVGRKDDVIVHSTGEKTVPTPMEGVVVTSPLVTAAVMFGRGRDEAGILIEPAAGYAVDVDNDAKVGAFRDAVWPVVEEANKNAPAYSHIFKELILMTRPDTPLPRTDKGTVARKRALKMYEEDIEKIYRSLESQEKTGEKDVQPPAGWDAPSVAGWLARHVREVTGRDVDPAADLFEQGFDSLNNTVLRTRVLGALRADPATAPLVPRVPPNVVYEHPSVASLAAFLSARVRKEDSAFAQGDGAPAAATTALAAELSADLPGYAGPGELPQYVAAPARALRLPVGVLITGTTGNLGADLLARLLVDERVGRVYAVERRGKEGEGAEKEDGGARVRARQRARFADKGLELGLLRSAKLVSLEGDVCAPAFGQSVEVYKEMLRTVSLIFHVAWRLDFNLGLAAFAPGVRGTRALVDFARAAAQADAFRLIFTNSIGAAFSWGEPDPPPVPESLIPDPAVARGGGGYGQAKYAAERVLAAGGVAFASVRRRGKKSTPRGAWATTDWFPILVKTSMALGALPDDEQEVAWVPSDAVAGTLLDAAFTDEVLPPSLNIVHPRPLPWSVIIRHVQDVLRSQTGRDLPLTPLGEWLDRLEAAAARTDVDVRDVPGIKLLEFFRRLSAGHGLGRYATDKMCALSGTLRSLRPLGRRDAEAWVEYWAEKGMFE
ncbi:hypothetical protein HDZ31DRAFT_39972 [Schizophyllum fasciatum]